MGYPIEIDPLSCHVAYVKPELLPAFPAEHSAGDALRSLEQSELKLFELKLESFAPRATNALKEIEE